jgi:hypothetical protein
MIPSGDLCHPSLGVNGTCFVYLYRFARFLGDDHSLQRSRRPANPNSKEAGLLWWGDTD